MIDSFRCVFQRPGGLPYFYTTKKNLEIVRDKYQSIIGITTLSIAICPDVKRSLTDEGVAEFIIGASQLGRHATLSGELMLCLVQPQHSTQKLDQII